VRPHPIWATPLMNSVRQRGGPSSRFSSGSVPSGGCGSPRIGRFLVVSRKIEDHSSSSTRLSCPRRAARTVMDHLVYTLSFEWIRRRHRLQLVQHRKHHLTHQVLIRRFTCLWLAHMFPQPHIQDTITPMLHLPFPPAAGQQPRRLISRPLRVLRRPIRIGTTGVHQRTAYRAGMRQNLCLLTICIVFHPRHVRPLLLLRQEAGACAMSRTTGSHQQELSRRSDRTWRRSKT
jgi:hypothetical protein